MENIENLLKQLNSEQKPPVLDTEGAVLVIAGAGSGKTRVLTTRIANLVINKGVDPKNILAITFTNKAADEMKNRLSSFIGDIQEMWVSTIHSMCVHILRNNIDKLGYNSNFTIYDDTDRDKLIKRIIEEIGLEEEKYFKLSKYYISSAKNDCLSPDEFKSCYNDLHFVDEIYKVYSIYEERMSKSNSLDFDDLLYKTYQLFLNFPEVADFYSNKFQYIHIDEFQDTNKVQFLLAKRLASVHGNIFVVGDDDQSIYGWRGAKIENILDFDKSFKNAKVYKLQQNYRSTKRILELANCVISGNTLRHQKQLWTNNEEGTKVELKVLSDENEEASYTAIMIKSLMERNNNFSYKDFAVFMRVNALSRAYEQEFTKYGIPYKIYGGFRFFERKEIKDILSYLKVVNNIFDDESFFRAISTPKRGIGDKTLKELKEFAVSNFVSMFEAISIIDKSNLSNGAKAKLVQFRDLLNEIKEYSKTNCVSLVIKHVIETTCFLDMFAEKNEENQSKVMNISELINSAEQFEKLNFNSSLSDYLNSVTLSSDTDDINNDNCVSVSTIHSVKGLEFPCVFIAGLDESILPIGRSLENDSELEEERRLFYVAITRAMSRLYITRANSRYMYGRRDSMTMSRFIKEAQPVLNPSAFKEQNNSTFIPSVHVDGEREVVSFGGYSSASSKILLKNNKPTIKNTSNSDYKNGTKVKHVKFGEGIVVSVSGEKDNLIVDVMFKGVGVKSLSVKYAPMEIIE